MGYENRSINKVLNGHTDGVYSLTVLQDGTLASGSGDGTIRLWDTKTGQSTKVFVQKSIHSNKKNLAE